MRIDRSHRRPIAPADRAAPIDGRDPELFDGGDTPETGRALVVSGRPEHRADGGRTPNTAAGSATAVMTQILAQELTTRSDRRLARLMPEPAHKAYMHAAGWFHDGCADNLSRSA